MVERFTAVVARLWLGPECVPEGMTRNDPEKISRPTGRRSAPPAGRAPLSPSLVRRTAIPKAGAGPAIWASRLQADRCIAHALWQVAGERGRRAPRGVTAFPAAPTRRWSRCRPMAGKATREEWAVTWSSSLTGGTTTC